MQSSFLSNIIILTRIGGFFKHYLLSVKIRCLPLENKEPHSKLCGPSFGRKERIYRSRKVANDNGSQPAEASLAGLSDMESGFSSPKVTLRVMLSPAR